MEQFLPLFILVGGAVLAALAASAGMVGASQMTSRSGHGYMHLIFYLMLLLTAMSALLSGRDMTTTPFNLQEHGDAVRHPVLAVLQPVLSLLIIALTGERIISHWLRPQKGVKIPFLLLAAFLIFWAGTVAAPALFGAHPYISHDYLYPLVIGCGMLLATAIERDLALKALRNAVFIFMAVSIALIPVQTQMVLDVAYTQGLFPGVPRLAGLAAHPVSLGVFALTGLLCLMACPYSGRWLNRSAWVLGLIVLFLCQSKTAWISFVVCSTCIVVTRGAPGVLRRAGDPMRSELGVVAVLGFMLLVLALSALAMFGDVGGKLANFFNSSQGAQLTSLTGRDRIWAIAYDEWLRNPVFGYGPTLWDENFRTVIGLPNATHAHNQFMDALSRSGTVGAAALVIYGLVLLVLSLLYTRASGGLSLALFLALALPSIGEVPLHLFGYGPDLITHMLLLMTLSASASQRRSAGSANSPGPASARSFQYANPPLGATRSSL